MIEMVSSGPGSGAQLRLRPPRALTARQFVALFATLAAAMWLVALLGWWGGNVFAPAFALLDSAMVAAALRWLWRLGERREVISIGPEAVEVWRSAQPAPAFRAHPSGCGWKSTATGSGSSWRAAEALRGRRLPRSRPNAGSSRSRIALLERAGARPSMTPDICIHLRGSN
jgi:hypothetical protein